jgi:hypothetical protein
MGGRSHRSPKLYPFPRLNAGCPTASTVLSNDKNDLVLWRFNHLGMGPGELVGALV